MTSTRLTFPRLRLFTFLLALAGLLISFPIAGVSAQAVDDDRVDTVTSTAIETSRMLESDALFDLYDRMHPDARNRLPRQAFLNWARSSAMGIPADDPVIGEVTIEDWTWEVTGETYDDAAVVSFTQSVERAGSISDEANGWVYIHDGGRWRWVPNLTGDEIDGLVSEVQDEPATYQPSFRRAAYVRIDRFWENVFAESGLDYEPMADIVPVTYEPFETGCGIEEEIDQYAIYYCAIDESVYYDPDFQDRVVDDTGPYGFTTIVAHEWGHHVQATLGIDISWDPELDGGLYPIEIELQADCLAGVYAQDALAIGDIDEEDVDAAMEITSMSGDIPGTEWDDLDAHGTSAQRVQSFYTGFEDGFDGCHIDLDDYVE